MSLPPKMKAAARKYLRAFTDAGVERLCAALTPAFEEAVEREKELAVAEARLEEAKWWLEAEVNMQISNSDEDARVADLQRRVEELTPKPTQDAEGKAGEPFEAGKRE